jgi:hypothetical protein
MSECSSHSSNNCNTGPHISVDDLQKGEQIVTVVKRENIPPPPKKCPEPFPWITITLSVTAALTVKTFIDIKIHVRPEIDDNWKIKIHPPSPTPDPHYPTHPPSVTPSPEPPYYPNHPQYPPEVPEHNQSGVQPPTYMPPSVCTKSQLPYCKW